MFDTVNFSVTLFMSDMVITRVHLNLNVIFKQSFSKWYFQFRNLKTWWISPKYKEMMAMHWRFWQQNWIIPKIRVLYIFFKILYFFFRNTPYIFWLTGALFFNLGTSRWFLVNFKGWENKILEKSENRHFHTLSWFLPGQSHIHNWLFYGIFAFLVHFAAET